jgi:hypothetical protein
VVIPPGEAYAREMEYRQLRAEQIKTERQIWDLEEKYLQIASPQGNLLKGKENKISQGNLTALHETSMVFFSLFFP